MDIGQSIRLARKAKGLTLEALANQVDTDTGNLSRLERGKQGASHELLGKIMKVLDMEVVSHIRPLKSYPHYNYDNLISVTPEEHRALGKKTEPIEKAIPVRNYPLLTWEDALRWHNSDDSDFVEEGTQFFQTVEDASHDGYWLTVVGDSMTSSTCPTFPEGMLILIRPASIAEPGKYHLVKLANGQMTFKQYIEDAGSAYLRPLNPAYRVIPLESDFEIVGRVIDTKMIGI